MSSAACSYKLALVPGMDSTSTTALCYRTRAADVRSIFQALGIDRSKLTHAFRVFCSNNMDMAG